MSTLQSQKLPPIHRRIRHSSVPREREPSLGNRGEIQSEICLNRKLSQKQTGRINEGFIQSTMDKYGEVDIES